MRRRSWFGLINLGTKTLLIVQVSTGSLWRVKRTPNIRPDLFDLAGFNLEICVFCASRSKPWSILSSLRGMRLVLIGIILRICSCFVSFELRVYKLATSSKFRISSSQSRFFVLFLLYKWFFDWRKQFDSNYYLPRCNTILLVFLFKNRSSSK